MTNSFLAFIYKYKFERMFESIILYFFIILYSYFMVDLHLINYLRVCARRSSEQSSISMRVVRLRATFP